MCQDVLDRISNNPDHLHGILFSDEATFHVGETVNKFNCRICGYENQHETTDLCFQSPKVTVWFGYTTRHIFGPYFFGFSKEFFGTSNEKEAYLLR